MSAECFGTSIIIGPNTIVHGNIRFVEGYCCAEDADIRGTFQQWTTEDLQSQFSKIELEIFQADQSSVNLPPNLMMTTKNVKVETYYPSMVPASASIPQKEHPEQANVIANFCPGCGAKIEHFMRFCPVCGTSLL